MRTYNIKHYMYTIETIDENDDIIILLTDNKTGIKLKGRGRSHIGTRNALIKTINLLKEYRIEIIR